MKQLTNLLLAFIHVLLLAGCATITNGPSQQVVVFSVPSGATVSIDGRPQGKTPVSVNLRRKGRHYATFSKECYQALDIPFSRHLQFGKLIVGNFFSWDLPGVITDLASGSAWQISPREMTARLVLRDDGASCLDYLSKVDYGYLYSLQTANQQELRGILQLVHRPDIGWRIVQLDLMANRIAKDADSMDFEAQEAIAPLCKEFEYSGYGRYKMFFYDVAAIAVNPRLKKMATVAAESLPNNAGELPNFPYSPVNISHPSVQGGQVSNSLALTSTVTHGESSVGRDSSQKAELGKVNNDMPAGVGSLSSSAATQKDPLNDSRDLYRQAEAGALSVAELDLIADSISMHRYLIEMDRNTEDSLSWLCEALGKSGQGRYKIFLNEIAGTKALPSKITRHAAGAAQSLPDNVNDSYHYP